MVAGYTEPQEQKEGPCHDAGRVRGGYLEDATLNLSYLIIYKRRRQEGYSRQRFSVGRKRPSLRGQQTARMMDRGGDYRVRAGTLAAFCSQWGRWSMEMRIHVWPHQISLDISTGCTL